MTIKVLLVEDSPVAVTILKRMINSADDMSLVGTARTGIEALELIPKVKPDVICTDLMMPKMNGLELTRAIMASTPKPILVISACVQDEDKNNVFQLLDAGAVDVFPKPRSGNIEDYEMITEKLLTRIRVLSGVKVFTKRSQNISPILTNNGIPVKINRDTINTTASSTFVKGIKVVAIASSTGGPQAFQEVLSQFPANFPVPVLCVQHISTGFLEGFINWLKQYCHLSVVVAQTGDSPRKGYIYFPPERQHLQLDAQGRFYCVEGVAVDGHCPSATVLFQNVARFYGSASIGVLMTGMGRDGALGLLTLKQKGAYTIVQNEATSIVFGMPQEAIRLGASKIVLPLPEIAPKIMEIIT